MLKRDSRYFRLGLTLLTVMILSALFIVALINIGIVAEALRQIVAVFSFVIYGVIFAYLMSPIQKLVEKLIQRIFARSNMTERGLNKLSRILGVLVSLLAFLAIIYGLLAMVLPELISSISTTFSPENLQGYYEKITGWLNEVTRDTPLESWLRENDPLRTLQEWITKKMDIFSTIGSVLSGAYGVGKVIFNMVIGLVVSVYLLIDKERYISQMKKFLVALFKPKWVDRLLEIGFADYRLDLLPGNVDPGSALRLDFLHLCGDFQYHPLLWPPHRHCHRRRADPAAKSPPGPLLPDL